MLRAFVYKEDSVWRLEIYDTVLRSAGFPRDGVIMTGTSQTWAGAYLSATDALRFIHDFVEEHRVKDLPPES